MGTLIVQYGPRHVARAVMAIADVIVQGCGRVGACHGIVKRQCCGRVTGRIGTCSALGQRIGFDRGQGASSEGRQQEKDDQEDLVLHDRVRCSMVPMSAAASLKSVARGTSSTGANRAISQAVINRW